MVEELTWTPSSIVGVRTEEIVPLTERLRSAFSLAGVDVEVQEAAPPTSPTEWPGAGVVLLTSKLSELGRVLVDDAGVKKLLSRLHDDRQPCCVLARGRDRFLEAAIDADLPPKAFLRLQGRLPVAPSGRIVYNRRLERWQDWSEAARSGDG